jgi:uncharacterized protein (TIGR03067 family)
MSNPSTSLEGTWQMIHAELNGESAPELVTSQTVLELKAGNYAVRYAGQVMDSGTYELGAEAGRMVLRGTSGPNAGRTIPCLYQITGNRLRVCYGLEGTVPMGLQSSSCGERYDALYSRQFASEFSV